MTEGQKNAIMERLCAADAATRFAAADAIRQFPDSPIYDAMIPVGPDPEAWAITYVESLKLRDHANYMGALAWFYADHRPTDALRLLIQTKLEVIGRGEKTKAFWKMLEELDA